MGNPGKENNEICGDCEFWNSEINVCREAYSKEDYEANGAMCELGEAYARVKRELELEQERLNEMIEQMRIVDRGIEGIGEMIGQSLTSLPSTRLQEFNKWMEAKKEGE